MILAPNYLFAYQELGAAGWEFEAGWELGAGVCELGTETWKVATRNWQPGTRNLGTDICSALEFVAPHVLLAVFVRKIG